MAANGCRLEHRQPNRYGENLFKEPLAITRRSTRPRGESEKKLYSGGAITQENSERIDHFTQRVWRDTTKLGCRETTQ
jgi:hypothetical protein